MAGSRVVAKGFTDGRALFHPRAVMGGSVSVPCNSEVVKGYRDPKITALETRFESGRFVDVRTTDSTHRKS
jgi:hypothetical protein